MTSFTLAPMRNNNIAYITHMREQIQLDPPYQRQGSVWSVEKKRLLIDSILNGFDIPKIYLHEHTTPLSIEGRRIRYSLIDGRQRLEAVWGFLDGEFALAEDFMLFEEESSAAAGRTFADLEQADDLLAARFMAINLDVILIKTDDIEMIEEMFSRLNEAVPLNAAEKRNGRGGAVRPVVLDLVTHPFFEQKLPFDNRRYRHYDLALKFLLWTANAGPGDAKKRQLDEFWNANADRADGLSSLRENVVEVLTSMTGVFQNEDRLLASVGMVSLYFLTFQRRLRENLFLPDRPTLIAFNEARNLGPYENEELLTFTQRGYLEFDSLAQRQTDGYALEFRLGVLDGFIDSHQSLDG